MRALEVSGRPTGGGYFSQCSQWKVFVRGGSVLRVSGAPNLHAGSWRRFVHSHARGDAASRKKVEGWGASGGPGLNRSGAENWWRAC